MAKFSRVIFLALAILFLAGEHECAVASLFLKAISSALATIPFTGVPFMGAGLAGAKLAIGSKLLYYLGFFGRRKSAPKPALATALTQGPMGFGGGGPFFPGAMPFPLMGGGGAFAPQQFGGFGGQAQNFLQGPQGGFGGGFDPAQLFQMLAAQGIDPMTAIQGFGGGGGFEQGPQQFGIPQRTGSQNAIPPRFSPVPPQIPLQAHLPPQMGGPSFGQMPLDVSQTLPPSEAHDAPVNNAAGSEEDVESFFTFLRDMDDNTCISRLICDIGADPSFLGDFSENINGIISSLEVTPLSGAHQYVAIMETGKREGGCTQRFPECTDTAYEIVKSVAPSVGVPQNINSETVNAL